MPTKTLTLASETSILLFLSSLSSSPLSSLLSLSSQLNSPLSSNCLFSNLFSSLLSKWYIIFFPFSDFCLPPASKRAGGATNFPASTVTVRHAFSAEFSTASVLGASRKLDVPSIPTSIPTASAISPYPAENLVRFVLLPFPIFFFLDPFLCFGVDVIIFPSVASLTTILLSSHPAVASRDLALVYREAFRGECKVGCKMECFLKERTPTFPPALSASLHTPCLT